MLKKVLIVLMFSLLVPTAAMAQTYTFSGIVKSINLNISAVNDQGAVYHRGGAMIINDAITFTLTDSDNGHGTITGDIVGLLHFEGNVLVPNINKKYIGQVTLTQGTVPWIDSDNWDETATFNGSGNICIVLIKDKFGNVTGAILKLNAFPSGGESQLAVGYPLSAVMVNVGIPAIKCTLQ